MKFSHVLTSGFWMQNEWKFNYP